MRGVVLGFLLLPWLTACEHVWSGGSASSDTTLYSAACERGPMQRTCLSVGLPAEGGRPSRLPLIAGGARFAAKLRIVGDAALPLRIESSSSATMSVEVGDVEQSTTGGRRNYVVPLTLVTAAGGAAGFTVYDQRGLLDHHTLRVLVPDSFELERASGTEPLLVAVNAPVHARFLPRAGAEVLLGRLPIELSAEPSGAVTFLNAWEALDENDDFTALLEDLAEEGRAFPGAIVRFSVASGDATVRVRFGAHEKRLPVRGVHPDNLNGLRYSRQEIPQQLTRSCTASGCVFEPDEEDFDATPLLDGAPVYGLRCVFDDAPAALHFGIGTGTSLIGDLLGLRQPKLRDEPAGFLGARAVARHSISATVPGDYQVTCRIGRVAGVLHVVVAAP